MSMIDPMSGRTYTFGPLEKRGVLAGLRAGQLAIIGSSFILALVILNSPLPSSMTLPLALADIASAAGLSWISPAGRGVDEWLPVVFRWLISSATKSNQWFSTLPLFGVPDSAGRRVEIDDGPTGRDQKSPIKRSGGSGKSNNPKDKKAAREAAKEEYLRRKAQGKPNAKDMAGLPPTLQNLVILEVPVGEGPNSIGVVKDIKSGLYTGVLSVRGDAFALLEQSEKERRLQAWADVLGGLTRVSSYVHRIQWIERAVPDDGDALNRYLAEARVQPDAAPTVRSYIDLLEEFGPVSQQHETFVALQINAVKASRIIKKAGGGDKGACMVLIRELRQLADSLAQADIRVDGALSPRLLAMAFRNAVDPNHRRSLVRKGRQDPERAGVAPANAWPVATESHWDHYRTENVFHATFWISEWPRLEVGPDFMAPLMVRTQRIRTVSLVMQPVEAGKAQREIESAHTAYLSDEELRSRAGYVPSERRRRELEGVLRREQELADGFSEFRFAGYVTVTGSSLEELEEGCMEIEQAAQQARLELRRLYGEQDVAFTCTLPLCRGLRK
jgi:hypothetical protein